MKKAMKKDAVIAHDKERRKNKGGKKEKKVEEK